ncbi:UNVERIFIED_CONTAM: hypothetical protein NCL1_34314 [Trichonephila clavipes]
MRFTRNVFFRKTEKGKAIAQKERAPFIVLNKTTKKSPFKCKRTRGSKESSIGLRQPQYKKKRTQEVRRYKKGLPSSLSEGLDRKRRPPIREDHKRRLMSSTASTEPVTKRGRRTEQNFGHIPGGGSRPGPEEERPLQSSRIQQGKSSPSQEQRRNYQESRFPIFRKNSTSPGGTIPVQKRPIQKTKPVPLQTASAVPTRQSGEFLQETSLVLLKFFTVQKFYTTL